MDQTDQKIQRKGCTFSAAITKGKLLLEINDGVTYKGEIAESPYYDITELKTLVQKGEVQVLFKTTSKMSIKISILKVELLSEENKQLLDMKNKIQELEEKIKNTGKWEEEDLNSTANFDMNCLYKIDTSSTYSMTAVCVSPATLYFMYSGSSYTTSSNNRRANSTGWSVTRLLKQRTG